MKKDWIYEQFVAEQINNKKKMNSIEILAFKMPGCAPCKVIAPILEALENVKVEFIDAMEDMDRAIQFKVRQAPTLVYLKDGEEVRRTVGLQTKESIDEILNSLN